MFQLAKTFYKKNAHSTTVNSAYSYFTYMIGLTKRSHVAPKMQHVTFCDSIVRFDWCCTLRIDSVCEVTWIPLCAKAGSVITFGRGKGRPRHVVRCRLTVRRALAVTSNKPFNNRSIYSICYQTICTYRRVIINPTTIFFLYY